MNKNKRLENQCVNLFKAINCLDKINGREIEDITARLADILSDKTLKLYHECHYTSREVSQVLKRGC